MFTQPLMYNRIRKLKPCIDLYSDKLISEGVVTKEEAKVGFSRETNTPDTSANLLPYVTIYVACVFVWLECGG